MRGSEGPVMSRSIRPTRFVGDCAKRDKASCTEDEDLPTPPTGRSVCQQEQVVYELHLPFPERTMIIFFTVDSLRDTGVSIISAISVSLRNRCEFKVGPNVNKL